jgi:hypothetical protein
VWSLFGAASSPTGLNEAVLHSAWADGIAISVSSGKPDGSGATGGHFVGNPAPWVGPQMTRGAYLRAPSVHVLGAGKTEGPQRLLYSDLRHSGPAVLGDSEHKAVCPETTPTDLRSCQTHTDAPGFTIFRASAIASSSLAQMNSSPSAASALPPMRHSR